MIWTTFWSVVFFGTLVGFVCVSLLVAVKGVGDLRDLFSKLRQGARGSIE